MKNAFFLFTALIGVMIYFSPTQADTLNPPVACHFTQNFIISIDLNHAIPAGSTVKSFINDIVVKDIEETTKSNGVTYTLLPNQDYLGMPRKGPAKYVEGRLTFDVGTADQDNISVILLPASKVISALAKKGYIASIGASTHYYGANNGAHNCPAATPRMYDLLQTENKKEK